MFKEIGEFGGRELGVYIIRIHCTQVRDVHN